jgi:oligopeptide transport system substrate-binding protein
MRLLIPLIAILGLIGTIAVGTRTARPRAELTFTSRGSLHTLDPASMSYMQDMQAAEGLWEGLMRLNPQTTEPIPGAAEAPPKISPDGKTYLFTIRSSARWSNGDPVTAQDFVRGWRRAIEPGTAEAYAYIISDYIAGANEYVAWRTQTVGVLGAIRQLQRGVRLNGADIRPALLSEAGGVLRKHLRTPIPAPPPDEVDPFWQKAAEELNGSRLDFMRIGDDLLAAHLQEMPKRFENVGLRVIDDHHLEVRLGLPTVYFRDLTAFSTYVPIHKSIEILRDTYVPLPEKSSGGPDKNKAIPLTETGLWSYDAQWTKPDYHRNGYPGLVTNGAFQLKTWRFHENLWLEANPYYWNAANVKSRTVDILDISYQNTSFMLFEQGRIDWLYDLQMDYIPALVQEARAGRRNDIHPINSFGTYYVTINCAPRLLDGRPNVLSNVHLRRALTMAVNRRAIVDDVERLSNPIATTFVPRGQIPGYKSPKGLDYDPLRAREELALAGYAKGADVPVIELLYNTDSNQEGKMQALKRMWEQELGLSIQLVPKETKAFAEDKDKNRFMLGRGGWFGDYNDPTTLDRAAHELDPGRRMNLLSEAEAYIMDEQIPIVPLFGYVTVFAWRPDVTGIYPNPRLQFPMQYIAVQHNNN